MPTRSSPSTKLPQILKVPVGTLRKWRTNSEGPKGFRAGKYVRYRRSAVERVHHRAREQGKRLLTPGRTAEAPPPGAVDRTLNELANQ
jgi:hypothetical protein